MALSYYVISTTERSIFEADAPTSNEITAALQAVAVNGGAWVGPAPRVTRTATPGERFQTRVAWLAGFDAPLSDAGAAQAAQALATRVDAALAPVGSFDATVAIAYNPAVNGSLAFWQGSGTGASLASASPTRDAFPELGGRLAANENPVGPSTPETVLPTLGQGVGQQLNDATKTTGASSLLDLAKYGLYIVAGGMVLYAVGPLLRGVSSYAGEGFQAAAARARARRPRRNPAKKKRSRRGGGR